MENFIQKQLTKRHLHSNDAMNSSWNSSINNGGSASGPDIDINNANGNNNSNPPKFSKGAWKRHYKAKREAKVVQKSAGHVDKIVSDMTQGLPFLLSTPNQPIAKFLRNEIVVGNMLGRGVFARVYEVKDFDLHDEEEEEELEQELQLNSLVAFEPPLDNGGERPLVALTTTTAARDLDVISEQDDSGNNANDDDDDEMDWGMEGGHRQQQHGTIIGNPHHHHYDGNSSGSSSDSNDGIHNGDDSTTAGTSSTAPASAPPTPPLTPASHSPEDATDATTTASSAAASGPSSSNNNNIHQRTNLRDSLRQQGATMRFSTRNYRHNLMSASRRQMEQSSLRLRARDLIRSGEAKYALKHLTKSLLRNPHDFYLAAAALLVEAKYLSKLNHPNIVKVTGLAMCGGHSVLDAKGPPSREPGVSMTGNSSGKNHARRNEGGDQEGIESGLYDSYFLISERLTDTLDRRMRQWKREQLTDRSLAEQSSTQKIETWRRMMRKTSYALQLSNALAYMHERNLLYRDLKPQNIGFIGDNQTIVIFNFGLCRELDPSTGKVEEDEVTAMYGALSWKYTAVECFPQPVVLTPAEFLVNSAKFLHNQSTRSINGLGLDSLSNSLHGVRGRSRRRSGAKDVTLHELEQELLAMQDEMLAQQANNSMNGPERPAPARIRDKKSKKKSHVRMLKPQYDLKVDVYSWAMVYYEMLTLRQPFSGMTQKEHLRKVAGPKGGQRPGVYQFDLTPSMISLLQRAWDQDPNKRPTMESVGRNLQLILRELEDLIKEEQKTIVKSGDTAREKALASVASKQDRLAKRTMRKAEKKLRKLEKRQRRNAANAGKKRNAMLARGMAKFDGLFAMNRYRKGDVSENDIPSLTTPGSAALAPTPPRSTERLSEVSKEEVDLAALEYEVWSDDDEEEPDDHSSASSSSGSQSSSDGASITDQLAETEITLDGAAPVAPIAEVDLPVAAEESVHETTADDSCHGSDTVVDAISAFQTKKRDGPTTLLGRAGSVARIRRTTKSKSMKQGRRNILDTFTLERRGTGRLSRRSRGTMRLSRASVWLMRRDVRIFVIVFSIVLAVATCGAGWVWYRRRQATWLGVDLDALSRYEDKEKARVVLQEAIVEKCRHEMPTEYDPNAPMLFQGGALSPVDLNCMDTLQRVLEDKMIRVTGVDASKQNVQPCGFLKMKQFEPPPPQPKKSKWRRKKPWKFFRYEAVDKPIQFTPSSSEEETTASEPISVAPQVITDLVVVAAPAEEESDLDGKASNFSGWIGLGPRNEAAETRSN